MEILQDPVFKANYQKYKNCVKLWESRFTKKHGRKPEKNDIKEADMKVKESYYMYWKLKTRALEEALIDITFSDDVQDNVPDNARAQTSVEVANEDKLLTNDDKQNLENVPEKLVEDAAADKQSSENASGKVAKNTQATSKESMEKKDSENVIPRSTNKNINDSSIAEPDCANVKGVWGDHLSKNNEQLSKQKESRPVGRVSTYQLLRSKFSSASLRKRNPRKSLNASKSKNKLDKSIGNSTNVSEQTANTTTNTKDSSDANQKDIFTFNNPVKATLKEPKSAAQSINTVQQLIAGYTVNRNLNPAWLERCAKQSNLEYPKFDCKRLSGTSDSGVESMESSVFSPKENIATPDSSQPPQFSDEEDFVCNSDSEEEWRSKRIRNFKKIISELNLRPSKRQCIENSINASIMQQQSRTMNLQTAKPVNSPVPVKTSSEEEKCVPAVKPTYFKASGTSVSKDKVTSNNVNTVENVVNKDIGVEEKETAKNTVNNRKGRKRTRRDSSADSDPEYKKHEAKQKKKKTTTTKRTSSSRRSKGSTPKGEKSGTTRGRRSSKKKMDEEDDKFVEELVEKAETTDKGPTIYGIETLEAIPRFAINMPAAEGDLIEVCAKSVSSASPNSAATTVLPSAKPKAPLTDKEKLEKKLADGKINENFVRINLKKKVFVRGKKHFNFSKYKKNQWKQKKRDLASSESNLELTDYLEKKGTASCFTCGQNGHFSRNCPTKKSDDLIPLEQVDETSEFPTLEEAEKMASQNATMAHANRIDRLPVKPSYSSKANAGPTENLVEESDDNDLWEPIDDEEILCGHKIPEELVSKLLPPTIGKVQPLYQLKEDRSCIETPAEVFQALQKFGHQHFRPGQEKAVMRILSGLSTLVTLSTGSGKSLCYQLPAYLYSKFANCITLVISPLVSLMDDQVTGVPQFLSAACLHTNQTEKVRENVMRMVKEGKLDVLLISPEAVVAGEKSTGFGALLRQLPPIAFACIDEAHCISQWSHNFRPSYLMVSRVLKEKFGVKTILALTATARKATVESIVNNLELPDGMDGVISDIPMPRNLVLTVSRDENRDQALLELLESERFKECDSIVVYCTRREECERIAGLLRASLQNEKQLAKPNSRVSPIAEAYHAGLSAYRRKTVQKSFMIGRTRIVVATVAFGMGLNKPDIRAVIHYNMPRTFENYVQEVGRAGRDGLPAHCHMFLSPTEDKDKWELRRHIYANGVDRHMIRRLLQKVFVPCSCAKIREKNPEYRCPGHEVAIPVDETVIALDISEETIQTLLCYLELHPKRFITVLSSVYVKARVSSYAGPQALKQAAQSSPPLAMAIALDLQKGISHEESSVIEFPVVDVAAAIGWDSGVVKSHLKNLEWKIVNGQSKRSPISVRYDTLGLRVRAPGDLTGDELDEALETLVDRARSQEASAIQQLETIGMTLHKFSMPSVFKCLQLDDELTKKSDELKDVIRNYFEGQDLVELDSIKQTKVLNEAEIASDIRSLIVNYRDNNFTGRAIARIFHGIQSPNYPAYAWNRCRFWRAHLSCDFNLLYRLATREILAMR